jgi:tRNA pseudouridine55 synthase
MTDYGFLNLNKPFGWTSHDCVAKVRGMLKTKKIGHGGTLDPAATGVLPLAVGKATRLLQFMPDNKAYRAKIRFGVVTDTDDLQGRVLETKSTTGIELELVEPLLEQFIGKIEQIPPIYSAIQKDGKRLYDLARQGKAVEVPTRTVEIQQIKVLGWLEAEFTEIELEISCGGGTYIRSIARDLGSKLGVGGTLAALERTESCGLCLEESLSLEELGQQINDNSLTLISIDRTLAYLPLITLDAPEAVFWHQGRIVSGNIRETVAENDVFIRVYRENGLFLGIGQSIELNGERKVKPKIVF